MWEEGGFSCLRCAPRPCVAVSSQAPPPFMSCQLWLVQECKGACDQCRSCPHRSSVLGPGLGPGEHHLVWGLDAPCGAQWMVCHRPGPLRTHCPGAPVVVTGSHGSTCVLLLTVTVTGREKMSTSEAIVLSGRAGVGRCCFLAESQVLGHEGPPLPGSSLPRPSGQLHAVPWGSPNPW